MAKRRLLINNDQKEDQVVVGSSNVKFLHTLDDASEDVVPNEIMPSFGSVTFTADEMDVGKKYLIEIQATAPYISSAFQRTWKLSLGTNNLGGSSGNIIIPICNEAHVKIEIKLIFLSGGTAATRRVQVSGTVHIIKDFSTIIYKTFGIANTMLSTITIDSTSSLNLILEDVFGGSKVTYAICERIIT